MFWKNKSGTTQYIRYKYEKRELKLEFQGRTNRKMQNASSTQYKHPNFQENFMLAYTQCPYTNTIQNHG